jgi:hypothetical protein
MIWHHALNNCRLSTGGYRLVVWRISKGIRFAIPNTSNRVLLQLVVDVLLLAFVCLRCVLSNPLAHGLDCLAYHLMVPLDQICMECSRFGIVSYPRSIAEPCVNC